MSRSHSQTYSQLDNGCRLFEVFSQWEQFLQRNVPEPRLKHTSSDAGKGRNSNDPGFKRTLRLLQWNVRGLSAIKLGELQHLECADPLVDVVTIQETHLQPGRSNSWDSTAYELTMHGGVVMMCAWLVAAC